MVRSSRLKCPIAVGVRRAARDAHENRAAVEERQPEVKVIRRRARAAITRHVVERGKRRVGRK